MLTKALGFIASLFPMGWGFYSMNAGLNSIEFGPVLGGAMFFTIGLVVAVVIIISIAEQIVNSPALTDCDQARSLDDKISRQSVLLYGALPQDDEERDWLVKLNTPDPQLVHPTDAKRERLNIKV